MLRNKGRGIFGGFWRAALRDYWSLQPALVMPNKKRICHCRNSYVLMSVCPSVVIREGPSAGRSAEWHSTHKEGMTSRENEPPVRCCHCCMPCWVEMWAAGSHCCCTTPVVRPWRCFMGRLRNDALPTADTMSLVVLLGYFSVVVCWVRESSCET